MEADVCGILAETAAAQIQAVLANQAVMIVADATLARARSIVVRMAEPDLFVTHDSWRRELE